MGSILNGFPNHIQGFKPAIGRGFIAHLSPHSLLGIQHRLVRREVLQVNPFVCPYETANFFPFVPVGAIYIQPDRIPPKPAIQLAEASEEAFSVPLGTSQHSHPPQQRSNPTKNVQPLVMLAGRWNPQPSADFTPPSTQTRMQRKTGFIFKDNGLLSPQSPEFFLTCDEIFEHLRCVPEDTNTRLASSDIPTDASMTEPGVFSNVFQIDFSDGPLRSAHPTGLGSDQIPPATFLNVLPTCDELVGSTEPVAQVSLWASGIPDLVHSPCASTDLSSDGSNQALRIPIPDVDPPMSTEEPLSLFQPGLPEFPELLATNRLDSLWDAPILNWGFA